MKVMILIVANVHSSNNDLATGLHRGTVRSYKSIRRSVDRVLVALSRRLTEALTSRRGVFSKSFVILFAEYR